MVPSAAEVRRLGDATLGQRVELRALVKKKAVDPRWLQRFYDAVARGGGLTRISARNALVYLRSLPDTGTPRPPFATSVQADTLRELVSTHLVPRKIQKVWMGRLAAGELTFDEADRTIREWLNLPLRTYVQDGTGELRSGWQTEDGFYALKRVDGPPLFYRVRTLPATGARVVDQIVGEKPERHEKVFGYQATQILRQVASNPAAAAALYGQLRNRCPACNNTFGTDTDNPGRAHGYGRDCWAARLARHASLEEKQR